METLKEAQWIEQEVVCTALRYNYGVSGIVAEMMKTL